MQSYFLHTFIYIESYSIRKNEGGINKNEEI